ncbi:nitrilase-related carbon-nitrogen hydrolase [Streptomyces flaveolus]|uniref:Nitrilase-related carbon-nitrogen hydrolase n=1 Tax=Streptomyces flaveolus TaxID=67297 RepID=A0ABV3AD85_9ACTN
MTVVRAAAAQLSPVLYSRAGTVEKVVQKIGELGKKGVEYAVFPETVVPYYPYFSYVQRPYTMAREHLRLLKEPVTVRRRAGAESERGARGRAGELDDVTRVHRADGRLAWGVQRQDAGGGAGRGGGPAGPVRAGTRCCWSRSSGPR